jgi:SAM-dependent methyltransferase
MVDAVKLKFYYDFVLGQVYDEGESPFHQTITADVTRRFIDPLELPKSSAILDLGCGQGYWLDEMRQRGFTNVLGLTLGRDNFEHCTKQGHRVELRDMNFLTERAESQDLLFSRHSLEHSPFPYITLLEYNRVLRAGGCLYIEVPAPDCQQQHENNRNHYSILGKTMWLSLLQRTGFDANWFDYEFPVTFADHRGTVLEKYFIFLCRKQMSVDVK